MTYPTSGPGSTGLGGFGSGPSSRMGQRGMNMELVGLARLTAKFKMIGAGVTIQGGNISEQVAQDIAEVAEDLAPFDPDNTSEPHVRDNIRVRRSGITGAEVFVNRGGVRDEVPAYLEFGTYKMAARPFLKPAARLVIQSYGVKKASKQVGGLLAPARLL